MTNEIMKLGLLELLTGYFAFWAIFVIVSLLAELFLSFIIAEDAILRGSKHPIRWGVCTFFLSLITILIYYLTRHREVPIIKGTSMAMPPDGLLRFAQYAMKCQKIRMKIILWSIGISVASIILVTIIIVLMVIMAKFIF